MRHRSTGLATLAAALSAVALAACGSSQTRSTSSTSPRATAQTAAGHACAGSQLAVSYAGSDGATGHVELTLALRNISDSPCAVRGYPGTRLLDRTGRVLPMRVSRGGGFFPDTRPTPRLVTLAPGASAHFGVSFVTNNEYAGAHACRTALTVMSAPPGAGGHWQRVPLHQRIEPCGDQLVVSPVHA